MHCVNCGSQDTHTKHPAHPTVNHCHTCRYEWNPDNERPPFVVSVHCKDKMGNTTATGYLTATNTLTASPHDAKHYTTRHECHAAIAHLHQIATAARNGTTVRLREPHQPPDWHHAPTVNVSIHNLPAATAPTT
jgi:hypothetical protein